VPAALAFAVSGLMCSCDELRRSRSYSLSERNVSWLSSRFTSAKHFAFFRGCVWGGAHSILRVGIEPLDQTTREVDRRGTRSAGSMDLERPSRLLNPPNIRTR